MKVRDSCRRMQPQSSHLTHADALEALSDVRKAARVDENIVLWAKREEAPAWAEIIVPKHISVAHLTKVIVRELRLDARIDCVTLHVLAVDAALPGAALDGRRTLVDAGLAPGSSIVVRMAEAAARSFDTGLRVTPRPSSMVPTAAAASAVITGQEALGAPLAFVNRYAEALDVLFVNLANHERLRCGEDVKFATPLASQPPGTGKTALGRNLTAILRRPREADAIAEADVADRLRAAWCWQGFHAPAVDTALQDRRDENLLVRTLFAAFPHHVETVMQLKAVEPLVIQMKRLVTASAWRLDEALAYSIFCVARAASEHDPSSATAFALLDITLHTSTGIVTQLIRERGTPIVLVLDDITDLSLAQFESYFDSKSNASPLHRAMTDLSLRLQLLHSVPGCIIFCTGRSLWLSAQALAGSGSPLVVQPSLLQPLTRGDIVEALRLTRDANTGTSLLESIGIEPHIVDDFAARIQTMTGGVARAVQYLLRTRQRERIAGAASLQNAEAVDSMLARLMPRVEKIPGLMLRIQWDGPSEAFASGELPEWTRRVDFQVQLVQLMARLLLLDAPFSPDYEVPFGATLLRLSDAAVVLGLSYCTAASPPGVAGSSGRTDAKPRLRLVAGEWLCRSLLSERFILTRPPVLVSVQMLATMRSFGGTMRGRPFELLCADALCARSLALPGQTLAHFLPHLSRSKCCNETVPSLRVVVLPKAVADHRLPRLTEADQKYLLQTRDHWGGSKVVHLDDLPWILCDWLPIGSLGVPADAQSGAQDMFLRLDGGVIGFALKAASSSAGTDWSDVRDELRKAPILHPSVPYTLVLWSLNLAPQLRVAVGSADATTYARGMWRFVEKSLVRVEAGRGHFEVVSPSELIVANPHAPSGGGLHELLGSRVLSRLHSMSSTSTATDLAIDLLAAWMSPDDEDYAWIAEASPRMAAAIGFSAAT